MASPFKGCTFDKTAGRWKARTTINGKQVTLGYHDSAELAYKAIQIAKEEAEELAMQKQTVEKAVAKYRKHTKVAQHNFLVEAPMALTLLQARLFVLMLRCIHKNDTGPKDILVPIEDLMGDQPLGGSGYDMLATAMKGLMDVKLELPVLDGATQMHVVTLVQSARLDIRKGVIVGMFGQKVLPYLMQLTNNFTLAEVADLMSLSNPSTHRFYWVMKSWEFRSPVTVTVEKLRALTTPVGTYAAFADYRNKVLKPSIDELNAKNFEITFTEKKKGRAVDSLEFQIKYHEPVEPETLAVIEPKATAKQLELQLLSPLEDRAANRLRKLHLTEAQIRKVLQVLAGDVKQLEKLLKTTHALLVEHETKSKYHENLGAAAMNILKTNFPALYPRL